MYVAFLFTSLHSMLQNMQTISGISILIHGVISLPDVKPCDKKWCMLQIYS